MNTVIVNDQPDWMHSLPGYKNEAKLNSKLRRRVKRSVKKSFDPSQPRDSSGRWTSESSAVVNRLKNRDVAGVIERATNRVEREFPIVVPYIEKLDMAFREARSTYDREEKAVRITSYHTLGNPGQPDQEREQSLEQVNHRSSTGFSDAYSLGIEGETYHELGHAVDMAMTLEAGRRDPDLNWPDHLGQAYINKRRELRGKTKTSKYGETSEREFVAEEFAREMMSGGKGPVTDLMREYSAKILALPEPKPGKKKKLGKSNPNHDDRGRFAVASNPVKPGSTPIPAGHIRLYHYTEAPPDTIRKEGLRLDQAKGSTYGEPNYVWASSNNPGSHKTVVEFHVPADDTAGRLEMPDKKSQTDLDAWHANGIHHVGFERDIKPEEIIAVHEPWHDKYRHIVANPGLMADVLAGKHDRLLTPKYPEDQPYADAVAYAKKRHLGKAFNPNEPRDWQGKWTRVGTIPGLVDWVRANSHDKKSADEALKNFDKAFKEHFEDAIVYDIEYPDDTFDGVVRFKYHSRPTASVKESTEPDEWGGEPHKVWVDTSIDGNPNYSEYKSPMPAMDELRGRPGVAFRGVSNEEMRNITRTGRIQSDSSRNFTDQKGLTLMAGDLDGARGYAASFAVEGDRPRFGKPGYVIAVDLSEQPHGLNSVREVDVVGETPADKILAVMEIALHSQSEGKQTYRLDGTQFSGEGAGNQYMQRDVTQEVKSKIEQRAAARRADEHRKRVRASVRSQS